MFPSTNRGCTISADRKAEIAGDATYEEAIQRRTHVGSGLFAIVAISDQLGHHRVVVHGDFATFKNAGIHTHMVILRRWAVVHQAAGGGQEIAERVLGINPGFNGPAVDAHIRLGDGQLLAVGHADHQFHQIDTGDQAR